MGGYRTAAGDEQCLRVRRTGSWEMNTRLGWLILVLWGLLTVAGGIVGYLHPAEDSFGIGLVLGILSVLPVAFGIWFVYAKIYLPLSPRWSVTWERSHVKVIDTSGNTQTLVDLNEEHHSYLIYSSLTHAALLRIEQAGADLGRGQIALIVRGAEQLGRKADLEVARQTTFEPGLGSSLLMATILAPYVVVGSTDAAQRSVAVLRDHLDGYDEHRLDPALTLEDGRVASFFPDRIQIRQGEATHDYPVDGDYQLLSHVTRHYGGKNQSDSFDIMLAFVARDGRPPLRFQLSTKNQKLTTGLAADWPDDGEPGGGAALPAQGDAPESMFSERALVRMLRNTAPDLPLLAFLQGDHVHG